MPLLPKQTLELWLSPLQLSQPENCYQSNRKDLLANSGGKLFLVRVDGNIWLEPINGNKIDRQANEISPERSNGKKLWVFTALLMHTLAFQNQDCHNPAFRPCPKERNTHFKLSIKINGISQKGVSVLRILFQISEKHSGIFPSWSPITKFGIHFGLKTNFDFVISFRTLRVKLNIWCSLPDFAICNLGHNVDFPNTKSIFQRSKAIRSDKRFFTLLSLLVTFLFILLRANTSDPKTPHKIINFDWKKS